MAFAAQCGRVSKCQKALHLAAACAAASTQGMSGPLPPSNPIAAKKKSACCCQVCIGMPGSGMKSSLSVVPHKLVAEVSKIGNYRRGELL